MKPLPFKMLQVTPMEKYRHDTFWTKEPETLAWIESFDPHDVFFDVGANVGVYSLYAASLWPEMDVVAFEPMLENVTALQENRDENGFWNILCLPYAVGNGNGWVGLIIPHETAGATGAQVIVTKEPKNSAKTAFFSTARIMTIDSLYAKPTHVKIDIDGQELEVVNGMQKTLPHIKSILIEVRPSSRGPVVDILTAAGFTMDNRFNSMSPHSRERRAKEGIPDENIVFTR